MSNAVPDRQVPVFIVGGGPAGLAQSQLLHRFGVRNIVVERSPGTTDHPKSRGCWIRTMELLESMAGREIGRTRPEPDRQQTPAWKCLVAQDAVEEELLAALQGSAYSTVLYSTEFLSFDERADGFTVHTRNLLSGRDERHEARYLIAADGAGSPTRRAAGIAMQGPATMAVMANEYWRADLSPAFGSSRTIRRSHRRRF